MSRFTTHGVSSNASQTLIDLDENQNVIVTPDFYVDSQETPAEGFQIGVRGGQDGSFATIILAKFGPAGSPFNGQFLESGLVWDGNIQFGSNQPPTLTAEANTGFLIYGQIIYLNNETPIFQVINWVNDIVWRPEWNNV